MYFMNLVSGKIVNCFEWDPIPITSEVEREVISLTTIEEQPLMTKGCPIFEWEPGNEILDQFKLEEEMHLLEENDLD